MNSLSDLNSIKMQKDSDAIRYFKRGISNKSSYVRRVCAEQLAKLTGKECWPALKILLTDKDAEVRSTTLILLVNSYCKLAATEIQNLIKDKDKTIKMLSILCLIILDHNKETGKDYRHILSKEDLELVFNDYCINVALKHSRFGLGYMQFLADLFVDDKFPIELRKKAVNAMCLASGDDKIKFYLLHDKKCQKIFSEDFCIETIKNYPYILECCIDDVTFMQMRGLPEDRLMYSAILHRLKEK